MLLSLGQKLVFIGDSITDCDRQGRAAPYGHGYVGLVRSLLLARYPHLGLTVVNRGVAGDTTRELAARWPRDVLAERPDWLAVLIGINDVWRAFDDRPWASPQAGVAGRLGRRWLARRRRPPVEKASGAVPLPEYAATLRRLLTLAGGQGGARLILMEPYLIEPDRSEPMRRCMDAYGAVVRELAAASGAVLVRTQAAFDAALAHTTPADWADDRIHPNAAGHAVIALAFLRAIGFAL
jgi:lysophospholipase L1-like esterase